MDVRVTDKPEFVLLTDRWGNKVPDSAGWPNSEVDEEAAIARLLPRMFDEMTFVARRLLDGSVGILVEGAELSHAESDDDSDEVARDWDGQTVAGRVVADGHVPTQAEVVAEAVSIAASIAESFPDLDVSVAHGPEVCMCRVMARAFVPESSSHIEEVEAIARRLIGQEPEASLTP